jgi:heme oxygenase
MEKDFLASTSQSMPPASDSLTHGSVGALDVLGRLRLATHSIHKEVEENSLMRGFLRGDLTLNGYIQCLTHLHAALSPLEQEIMRSPHLQRFPSVQTRQYFTSLELDLRYFGIQLTGVNASVDFRDLSVPALAGRLYVLEGSANGGRVMASFLRRQLSLTAECGMAYFSSQQALAPERWPGFVDGLLSNILNEEMLSEAINEALLTFATFKS